MKRRKVIKLTAYLASGSTLGVLATGCKSDTVTIDLDGYAPSYLSKDQYAFIKNMADTLLPETDTPGATSLGVPQIYDTFLNNILTEDSKKQHANELQELIKSIQSKNDGQSISKLSSEDRLNFLTSVDQDFSSTNKSPAAQIYRTVKSRIINYYLNTEEVGTKLLNYLPVPGEYKACISLDEAGGKAWTI